VSGLDRPLLQRFGATAAPYWRGDQRWWARGMLALLVLLLLAQTLAAVLLNEQTGEFTSALAARDADRFWAAIRLCIVVSLVAAPVYALYFFVRDTLGIRWRRWMTHRFLGAYLADHTFYRLNAADDIDNPDQRIAEDIHTFTQQSLYFLMVALGALIQLLAFTGVLWSISRELVFFLIAYAIAGTALTTLVFGKALIGLNFLQLRREADFRFSLIRIREHAEAIALHHGEARESGQAGSRFQAAFDNFRRLLRAQLKLNLFQYVYAFLTVVLPSAIIADRVLSGELEVGRAVQAAGAFAAILGALTVIIDHFEGLSRFAAGTERLHAFAARLGVDTRQGAATPGLGAAPVAGGVAGSGAAAGAPTPPAVMPQPGAIEAVRGPRLALEHVTLETPRRERVLVQDLSLAVEPGAGLMIVGRSGGGKSSLLRAIAGLWDAGGGRIVRPGPREMMFLPQQPYMMLGSLRSQITLSGRRGGGARPGPAATARAREPRRPGRALRRPGRRARLGEGAVGGRAAAARLRARAAGRAALCDARRGHQRTGRGQRGGPLPAAGAVFDHPGERQPPARAARVPQRRARAGRPRRLAAAPGVVVPVRRRQDR
jgi:putative ATP-binding cassette transporter